MKDGTTRMAYKAEHAVDLDTDIVVAATVHPGNAPDTQTIIDTAIDAAVNAEQAGVENDLQAIVADKGYHSTKVVTLATDLGMRAYIPERASPNQRRWADKDPAEQRAVYNARRRAKRTHRAILRSCLRHRRGETNMAARTRKRDEATPDDGRGAQSLDDHANDLRNRWSEEHAGAPRSSANRLDSLRAAPVGSGSPGGGAGRAHGAVVSGHQRLMIRRSETQKSTWATGC